MGELAIVRALSGPGRGLFSQLLVTSVQCEGEQLSQACGMSSASREAMTQDKGRWPLMQGPSPPLVREMRAVGTLEILSSRAMSPAVMRRKVLGILPVTAEAGEGPSGHQSGKVYTCLGLVCPSRQCDLREL